MRSDGPGIDALRATVNTEMSTSSGVIKGGYVRRGSLELLLSKQQSAES